jgi:hypothetical protein
VCSQVVEGKGAEFYAKVKSVKTRALGERILEENQRKGVEGRIGGEV